jgi:hypothetical protein
VDEEWGIKSLIEEKSKNSMKAYEESLSKNKS